MPAVEVEDLVVKYGQLSAVDGLSMQAFAGEVVVLLGPNGAGKTTTVETLEGYRRPASGRVRVLGLDPASQLAGLAPRIGVMLQSGGVYPSMGPREVLRLFASYYPAAEDTSSLLERLGLQSVERTPWRHLSGGERQRVSLALALVGRPEVAFLDEPTSGVDPSGRVEIRRVIAELRDSGVCVLLTTHELEEADRLADRILIIDRGRVLAEGSPRELGSQGAESIRFRAPANLDLGSLSKWVGAEVTEEEPGEYRVRAKATPREIAAVTAWLAEHDVALVELRAGEETLEEVFLRLTARDRHTRP